jgi:hypothetical protein
MDTFNWGNDAKIMIENRDGMAQRIEIYLDEVYIQIKRNFENPLADIITIKGQLTPLPVRYFPQKFQKRSNSKQKRPFRGRA